MNDDSYDTNIKRRIMERDILSQIPTRIIQNIESNNNINEDNEMIQGMPLRSTNLNTIKKTGLQVRSNYNVYDDVYKIYNKFIFSMFNTILSRSKKSLIISPYDILICMSILYKNGVKFSIIDNIFNGTEIEILKKDNIFRTNYIFTNKNKFDKRIYNYNEINALNNHIYEYTNIKQLLNNKITTNMTSSSMTIHTGNIICVSLKQNVYSYNNYLCMFELDVNVYDDGKNKILELEMTNNDIFGIIIGPSYIDLDEFYLCLKNIKKLHMESLLFPNITFYNKLCMDTYLKSEGFDDLYNGIIINNIKYNVNNIIHNVRIFFTAIPMTETKTINNIINTSFIYYIRDVSNNLILYFGYHNNN